jgi:hypothetical protein
VLVLEYDPSLLDKKPPAKETGILAFFKQIFGKKQEPQITISLKTEEKHLLSVDGKVSNKSILNDGKMNVFKSEIIGKSFQKSGMFLTPENKKVNAND